ncbi:hypothetical protein [Citricoccus sp.]|uniref:hypothetical protein n=1 Tax=Citricoccus sp. TaxID=1978372 RepID=UPI0028BD49BA|nr:hypothetical protein [Citricoccus sp.]
MTRRFSHEELSTIRPVKESAEDDLLARPGVVGVDIGEKVSRGNATGEAGILVFVQRKKPLADLAPEDVVPPDIGGVKTDVQEMEIELQSAMQLLRPGRQVDGSAYPVLAGGISMGPARSVFKEPPEVEEPGEYLFVGTLGALVRDRAGGAAMAMTNFHVACVDDSWSEGDRMVQPGRPDGGHGTDDQFGSLTRAVLSEDTDGAVVTIDEGREWEATVTGIAAVAGSIPAEPGMEVQKRGRTTEHTFGTVASTEATISLDYGDGLGSRTFRHQVRISTDTARSERFSDGGDSGSVVMDGNNNVVGLLFAGATDGSATFANPVATALDELGVDLAVEQEAEPPETPSESPGEASGTNITIHVPSGNVTINVVVGGNS